MSWTGLSKNFGNPDAANTEFTLTGVIDFGGNTGIDSDVIPTFVPVVFDNNTNSRDLSNLPFLDTEGIGGIKEVSPNVTALNITDILQIAFCVGKNAYSFGRSLATGNATSPPANNDLLLYQIEDSNGIVSPSPSQIMTVGSDPAASGVPNTINAVGDFNFVQGGIPAYIVNEVNSLGLSFCAGYRWSEWTNEDLAPLNIWFETLDSLYWARIETVLLTNLRR